MSHVLPPPVQPTLVPTVEPGAGAFVRGVGLHTGKEFQLRVRPSLPKAGDGIEFFARFEDLEFHAPALWTRISALSRSTSLVLRGESRRKLELCTIEHFLAAAAMMGLRRARVELTCLEGDTELLEMPALGGCAASFLPLLRAVPVECFTAPTRGVTAWSCVRPFELRDGARAVVFAPLDLPQTQWDCRIDFPPSWQQRAVFTADWLRPQDSFERFARELAPARTFGFTRELQNLAARGLARGGSLANAVLLDEDRVVNEGGLLFPNELAAHKLVDAMGDFALLGGPVLGRIELQRAGHEMHARALREAVESGAVQPGRLLNDGRFVPEN